MSGESKWKSLIILTITMLGVVVPIVLWFADREARSLSVQIVSQTALQPTLPRSMPNVEVLVDGREIERPYLNVIQLSNDGSTAIRASDFDAPLDLIVIGPSSIVRSEVTTTIPIDLSPKTSVTEKRVSLGALLLNPGDVIRLSIITANGPPRFRILARVTGISKIGISKPRTRGRDLLPTEFLVFASVGLVLVYGFVTIRLPQRTPLDRVMAFFCAAFCAMGSLLLVTHLLMRSSTTSTAVAIGVIAVGLVALIGGVRTGEWFAQRGGTIRS